MSAALRFLAVAVVGWAVLRASTLGMLPGAEAFTVAKAEPAPPPIVPTEFPPIPPVQAQTMPLPPGYADPYASYGPYGPYPPPLPPPRYAAVPVYYYPAAVPAPAAPQVGFATSAVSAAADPGPSFYSPIPELESWDLSRLASSPLPTRQSRAGAPAPIAIPQLIPPDKLDRLQLTTWALLRGRSGTGSLASGGTLGGSQAGARLTYALNRQIAASLRSSSPVGGSSGGEVAAGVRFTPFRSIPVSLTAERRQAIGRMSTGRSAFALFLEGGVYQQPVGWGLLLDGYAQAGVVGAHRHDLFADGGLSLMRPLYGRFSVGVGAWGGYQPGLYRIDAGPRVSMRVRRNVRVDLDWRQRLAGTAEPGSGPAVTLAADF